MSDKIKILLVEDDENLGFVMQDSLMMLDYEVSLSVDGKEGLSTFNKGNYDLCLLDVMLPKKDGFSLAEDIRKIDKDVPIVFLTAKSLTEDKIRGFQVGADDYITKPFSMDEFQLRIEAILKRAGKTDRVLETERKIGKFVFDMSNFKLILGDDERKLTKKEAEILKLLSKNKGKVVERELILNLVWGDDNYFNGRSLDVFITKLRKYLKADEGLNLKNVHGIGFVLKDEED